MARIYSRKKGKSASRKPEKKDEKWVKDKEKIEKVIVELAKKGLQGPQIGLELRDKHKVPTVRVKKHSMERILEKHELNPEVPVDLFNLLKKAVNLHVHMDKNKKDFTSKRGLELTESKIRRVAKYYIREKKLPQKWKYNIDQAKLLVK